MNARLRALLLVLALIAVFALSAAPRAAVGQDDPLYALRVCESGNDYTKDTGNGFYGAYQFGLTTWRGVGGEGYPHLASPEEQDARAWTLLTRHGSQHWPVCQYRLDAHWRAKG